jgi:hypothetical protein
VPTQTHLAAALTNPPSNRPEMMQQSTSTTLPQTMHFAHQGAHTSNYGNSTVQQMPAHPVQIRIQQMPVSASTMPQAFEQGAVFASTGQPPMFAVPLQRAPLPNQLKTNGPMAGTSTNNLAVREAATNAKDRYRQIKRKFKFLVYVSF